MTWNYSEKTNACESSIEFNASSGMGWVILSSPLAQVCVNTDIPAHTALQGHQSLSLFLGFHSASLDSICKEKAGSRSRHLLISVCFYN